MSWIELTEDEVRAARIEARAARSAGVPVDPRVAAMARALVRSPEWIEQHGGQPRVIGRYATRNEAIAQTKEDYNAAVRRGERPTRAGLQHADDEEEPTNDISEAMNRGLTSMFEAEGHQPVRAWRPEPERVAGGKGSWLSRLFGR